MSRILEKMKKLVGKIPEAEQDEFFEFVASLGEQEQPPEKAKETETKLQPKRQEEPATEPSVDEQQARTEETEQPKRQEEKPKAASEPETETMAPEPQETPPAEPSPEQDPADESEFYDGAVEDIPQIVKSKTDESAIYDPNADNVEMHGGSGEDSAAQEPTQDENAGGEQGDIVASLQAKITALEAENAQMKAKFGASFGYGNAPSSHVGKYQTADDFIRSLPQIRKG